MGRLFSLLETSQHSFLLSPSCTYHPHSLPMPTTLASDHFDQEVEASLRRDLPIVTTPHAKDTLTSKGAEDSFNQVYDLGFFEFMMVNVSSPGTSSKVPQMKVTGMPGKYVRTGFVEAANDLVQVVRIIRKVVPKIFVSLQLTRERCHQRMGECWSWARQFSRWKRWWV
jgi:hypothetical protein